MCGMFRTLGLFVICGMAAYHTHAQSVVRATDTAKKASRVPTWARPKGPKAITGEMSVGLRLNSDGWSIFTDIGSVKSSDPKHSDMFYNVRLLQLEVSEKKDPREYQTTSKVGSGTDKYILGKINNFYAVKLGVGSRTMIAGKPDPGTVSIHWVNAGGLSLGLLKPYYLNAYIGDPTAIKYSDATKSTFLDPSQIESSAGFSKGLSEISIVPGVHFKSAVHFDFSTNRKNVIGVETGVNAEYYSKPVPLMAGQTAKPYFFDIYLAAQFGRRW
jgi:hypothetical protein